MSRAGLERGEAVVVVVETVFPVLTSSTRLAGVAGKVFSVSLVFILLAALPLRSAG